MKIERMVIGVLDVSRQIDDPAVAKKLRDFTISWSRYDYRGEILEGTSVNEILDRASSADDRWCLILPHGHVIAERWTPEHWEGTNLSSSLRDRLDDDDFLVAGSLMTDPEHWLGFDSQCLLVNLEMYQRLSSPAFESDCPVPIALPKVELQWKEERIAAVLPSAEIERKQPSLSGWHFIAASLRAGVPVVGFGDALRGSILNLSAQSPESMQLFANYLGTGIAKYEPRHPSDELTDDQTAFLTMVQPQTTGARNGVFLWNIEAYSDIETPSDDFSPPVSSLYSVAAGFKPNRILQTHGWDASTRVVHFDYSPRALELRKYMVEHWDGADFPKFVERLFRTFPHPQTFYQLWDGLTPENVDSADIERMWQRELQRWGTARDFQDHWQSYAKLEHVYVDCNIMGDPTPLFDQIADEPSAIIWWSNAFFTVYGNWFCTLDERKQVYDNWIQQLARLNPELHLFGSDFCNVNVNSVRAGEYWEAYQRSGSSWLRPCRLSKTEMRM